MASDDGRGGALPYRRVGRSGVLLSGISLGLWQGFGDGRAFDTQRAIVERAFDLGVTHFDLADNYGPPPGAAERTFGRILRSGLGSHRDEMIVSSKAGYPMWDGPYGDGGSRKHILAGADQSLRRLGLDYVDIFYSHRLDPQTPLEETMGALDALVRAGKALYIGISNYPPEQTRRAAAILRELGTPCLIHQFRYNMLNRAPEGELARVLDEEGIGGIAFSPLAQGMLTDRYLEGIPSDSRATRSAFLHREDVTPELVDRVRRLAPIAERRGQSIAQLALSWDLRLPGLASVLVGASSVQQLEANVQAAAAPPLSEADLAEIDEIFPVG